MGGNAISVVLVPHTHIYIRYIVSKSIHSLTYSLTHSYFNIPLQGILASGEPAVSRRTLDLTASLAQAVHYPVGGRELTEMLSGLLAKYRSLILQLQVVDIYIYDWLMSVSVCVCVCLCILLFFLCWLYYCYFGSSYKHVDSTAIGSNSIFICIFICLFIYLSLYCIYVYIHISTYWIRMISDWIILVTLS